jgi:hypothetical protein
MWCSRTQFEEKELGTMAKRRRRPATFYRREKSKMRRRATSPELEQDALHPQQIWMSFAENDRDSLLLRRTLLLSLGTATSQGPVDRTQLQSCPKGSMVEGRDDDYRALR